MRLFLAIELPDDVRQHLIRVQKTLLPLLGKPAMTRHENLHVTLKFLGEVDERNVAELCESIGNASGGPIELASERLECFPPRGPVRIVAAAMGGGIQALAGIHAAIEQRCQFLGFEKENRAYRPHVTIARLRHAPPGIVRDRMREATDGLWPTGFAVTQFFLMESRLERGGAQYTVAARFLLSC